MNNIMIDLETMGVGPTAAIIALGAVEFYPDTNTLGREFYQVIDLESAVASGGVMGASTVLWWMRQSDEARAEFSGVGAPIKMVLRWFREWLYDPKSVLVWGNGSDFDNVILRSAYVRSRIEAPWNHKNNRCFRTVRSLFPPVDTGTWEGVQHCALDDAKWQARYLMEVLK